MAERRSVAADVLGSNPSSRPNLLSIDIARRCMSLGSESTLIRFSRTHFPSSNFSRTSRSLTVVPVPAPDAASGGEATVVSANVAKAGNP